MKRLALLFPLLLAGCAAAPAPVPAPEPVRIRIARPPLLPSSNKDISPSEAEWIGWTIFPKVWDQADAQGRGFPENDRFLTALSRVNELEDTLDKFLLAQPDEFAKQGGLRR